MADKYETPVLEEGVYRPDWKTNLTGRRDPILGGIRDTVLETAASAIDVLATPYAYGRDYGTASGDKRFEQGMQLGQQAASMAKDWVRSGKTDYGRQEDANGGENATWLDKVASVIPTSGPMLATAAATGLAAPATFGGLAHGQQSQQFEEQLFNTPRDQLEKTEGYQKFAAQGMSHEDILRAMHTEARNDLWGTVLPNVGANVIFGGVASHLVGKMGSRTIAQSMKDRILKSIAVDTGEAIVGGAVTGGGQAYGRQSGQIAMGTRSEYDYPEIGHEAVEMATTVAPFGVGSGLMRGRRPAPGPPPQAADVVKDVIDKANQQVAPAIGTDLKPVAIDNLSDVTQKTEGTPPVTPPVTQAGNEPPVPRAPTPTPTGSVEGTPVDVNGRMGVSTGEPFAHSDGKTYQRVTYDDGTLGVVPVEQVKARAPEAPVVAAPIEIAPRPPVEVAPVASVDAVAPPVEAVAPPVDVVSSAAPAAAEAPAKAPTVDPLEALRAKITDLAQSPTESAVRKHLEAYQKATGTKLGKMYPELVSLAAKTRADEKARVNQERLDAQKAASEAKQTAAAEAKVAKEATKADKVKAQAAELEKKTKAREAKLADKESRAKAQEQAKGFADAAETRAAEERKAAAEQAEALKKKAEPEVTSEGKPEPKAEPPDEKPNPETLRAKLGLKPKGTGVVHGEAAEPDLVHARAAKAERGREAMDLVVEGEKKLDKIARESMGTAERRDVKYTAREKSAKGTITTHQPGGNRLAMLDEAGETIKNGDLNKPEDAKKVRETVGELVADAKAVFDDYTGKLAELAKGTKDPIYQIARGGGKSRAFAKGDYHAFISDLNNFVLDANKALEKGDLVKAKELALKHLADSQLVREGDLTTLAEQRQVKNDAVTTHKKTYSNTEGTIGALSKEDLDKLTEGERQIYNEQMKGQEARDEADKAKHETETADRDTMANVEARADAIAAVRKKFTPEQRAKFDTLPHDVQNRLAGYDPAYPRTTMHNDEQYLGGKEHPLDQDKVDELKLALDYLSRDVFPDKLSVKDSSEAFEDQGEKVWRGKIGDLLGFYRPSESSLLRPIFDAVHAMTKDMPLEIWSHDMMEAYSRHSGGKPAPLGLYSYMDGVMVVRHDTATATTVFHEALHAATSRAILGSERLNRLISELQKIVESRYKTDIDVTGDLPFQIAIRGEDSVDAASGKFKPGAPVNAREFIAELFSRPEIAKFIASVKLTPAEARKLTGLGYRVDTGKSLMKTLWDALLSKLGFKSKNPNAFKVSVDLLQDTFEREMKIRETDEAVGRKTGTFLGDLDYGNLMKSDPVGGPGIVRAWQAGDFERVSTGLLDMNERGVLDAKASDSAIRMLEEINNQYFGWGQDPSVARSFTPLSNPAQIHKGVSDFIDSRLEGAKNLKLDLKFQGANRFSTPLRKVFSGIQYTNDIGNTLGDRFREVLRPLKDAWSRREHHAQEYMNTSGANKLIDDLATLKHEIKDRGLWEAFERLLIRESYSKAYADQPLGVGLNEHVKAGELKWQQTETDHAINRQLYDAIAARSPKLIAMRARIFEFSRKELDTRLHHQAMDMLLKENVVPHGDEAGLNALAKSVRRLDKSMTPEERKAMDRVVGTDINAKKYKDFVQKRDDIREVIDTFHKNGPHVPFMRHGNHAVFAEYHITPDAGVKYNEVNPEKAGDLNKMYDFANEQDARDFINNVLNHENVQVTVNAAHEVIYDTSTGERARTWSVDKPDGTTKTYTSEAEARTAVEDGDKLRSHDTTAKEIKDMAADGQPTAHFETRHRVTFNPTEFVRFDNERLANEYRERLNRDDIHPNVTTKVTNVESPKTLISRANVAYTSAELKQWINRIEGSPIYQSMTQHQRDEWQRELRLEAARVTMTAGRRTMHLPREYAKGASTGILKNMIDFAGSNSRAIAELKYRDAIDKGVAEADKYVNDYRYSAGRQPSAADPALRGQLEAANPGMPMLEGPSREEMLHNAGHRARDDAMREIKARLYAPISVEGSWATGIKRALQVSMISHLADTGYLIVNAMEPWVFGASVTAGRHGLASAYKSLAAATRLVDPVGLAKAAGEDIAAAYRGEFKAADYEKLLLDRVTGRANTEGDGAGLSKMLQHMFGRGLISRDVGAEVARIHDPSANILFRGLDRIDEVFRGFNTGIETLNRASMAISNYRLEMKRALKDGLSAEKAHEQAVRYAEESVFKGAGDYAAWNNPRYFNNPFMKLALQFKKYPLRIFSVYAEAVTKAFRGDKEAQKQVAYMLAMQALAAGGLGLPIGSFGAGAVNAAYILGATDDNWDDMMFGVRKKLVDSIGVEGADLVLHGALRFSGADFSAKMSQNSIFFMGSAESRDTKKLMGILGLAALGAPGDTGAKYIKGIQQLIEAGGHYSAGAHDQAMQTGMQGASNLLQLKIVTNFVKMLGMMTGGSASGLPKGQEASTGQAIVQGLGFTPTGVANKREAKQEITREKRKDSEWRKVWTDRWVGATSTGQKSAVWSQIQKDNQSVDPRLRIKYEDLWKAQERAKNDKRHDDLKLGVRLSGRQKAFADRAGYFDTD